MSIMPRGCAGNHRWSQWRVMATGEIPTKDDLSNSDLTRFCKECGLKDSYPTLKDIPFPPDTAKD